MEEITEENEESGSAMVQSFSDAPDTMHVSQQPLAGVPDVDRSVLEYISEEIARENGVVIFSIKDRVGHVAMLDTSDINALNILRFVAQQKDDIDRMELYRVPQKIFGEILKSYGTAERAVHDVVQSFASDADTKEIKRRRHKKKSALAQESVQDAPVAKLVNVVVNHAIDGRASDIHIEPFGDQYRVRFRVDGVLHSSLTFPKDVGRAVVSHIKILSNLKIDEKRKPQDGRFKIQREGEDPVDFRVSTLPVVDGEKVVIRVLKKDKKAFNPKELGLIGRNHDILMERIRETFGIILITGPTGSGKSTTLYGFLRILNEEQRNIITLEDPVEYHIDGVNQSQVRPEINYTFANGLRSILRQDPNVLMVGEIRDGETAELAIHAALTGHLVFSTLHTNSAVGAIPRFTDMGVEPFLLAAALREVVAQRLVRRICEKCKEKISVSPRIIEQVRSDISSVAQDEVAKYGVDTSDGITLYHGAGCDACGDTGYKGRVAIYEVIGMDDEIQSIITEKGGSGNAVEKAALAKGMITMRQDGILKALLGLTTLEEVIRLTDGSSSIGSDGTFD